jgi:hypothetical protein
MAHRPDGRTSIASNFLIRHSSFRTMGDERPDGYSSTRNFHICNPRVRTMIGSRPDGWSRIGNFLLWCTRVRTTAVRRPDLKKTRIWTGYHIVRTVDWSSLSWNLERNQKMIEYWETSGRAAETPGRMQAGTETSRYSMGSGRNDNFVRTDDAGLYGVRTGWHVVQTDGTVDRWASGRDGSIVRTADRELEILLTCRQKRLTSLWKWNPCLPHLYT